MLDLLKILIVLALLIFLVWRKLDLGLSILSSAVLFGILFSLPFESFFKEIPNVILSYETIQLGGAIILVLIFFSGLSAQQYTIKGTVKDMQTEDILAYANIRVAGTTMGTAANTEGKYELKLNAGKYVLVASYIGYYSDTVAVNLSNDIRELDFKLKKTEVRLAEIIIRPGENPALQIIRKAIERKKERNSRLFSYEFEAYTKGIVRTDEEINPRGNTISLGVGVGDSSGMKITGVLENKSKGFFKKQVWKI